MFLEHVTGMATFDLNGLPQWHFTLADTDCETWIQVAFQTLCLESILSCSLRLKECNHIRVHGDQYDILIVRQVACYVGLLSHGSVPEKAVPSIIKLVQTSRFVWQGETELASSQTIDKTTDTLDTVEAYECANHDSASIPEF